MRWNESKAASSIKRLVRAFGVKAEDRREFVRLLARTGRAIVPRLKRRSRLLERLKSLLANGLSIRAACDQTLLELQPGYRQLPPDRKAREREKLQANLRAHRSYHRRKSDCVKQHRAKPRGR